MTAKYQAITACVFLHKKGKLFIAKRAKTKKFLPDKYELIGGHIEFGETVEQGLMREIKEELHVEVIINRPYHVFTYLSENGHKHSVEIDYLAELADPNQLIRLNPEDHSDFKWIGEDEIDFYFTKDDAERLAILEGFKVLKN